MSQPDRLYILHHPGATPREGRIVALTAQTGGFSVCDANTCHLDAEARRVEQTTIGSLAIPRHFPEALAEAERRVAEWENRGARLVDIEIHHRTSA